MNNAMPIINYVQFAGSYLDQTSSNYTTYTYSIIVKVCSLCLLHNREIRVFYLSGNTELKYGCHNQQLFFLFAKKYIPVNFASYKYNF